MSGTSKEANKEVAKDSNAGIGTRASAAKDAASDKVRPEISGIRLSRDLLSPGMA
jgi:hypothetical protein